MVYNIRPVFALFANIVCGVVLMKRGLVVGRFQPYHLGHHKALLNALKEVDEMIIVIGSPEKSFELSNPFTAGERIEMISNALKASKVFGKCHIVPVPNIKNNSLWVKRIESFCPDFDILYTNSSIVRELFLSSKHAVRSFISKCGDIEAKYIRVWLRNDIDINDSVPKSVNDYLAKIGARTRLKSLYEKEEKQ